MYRGKDIFEWYLWGIIDSLPDTSSRYSILSVNLCCIPVVMNSGTLVLLLTSVPKQAFISDMMIVTHKYALCLSLDDTIDVSDQTMRCATKTFFPSPSTRTRAQIGDNYAHALKAETRLFLLLRRFGPRNEASIVIAWQRSRISYIA